jgi:hypothetical protein
VQYLFRRITSGPETDLKCQMAIESRFLVLSVSPHSEITHLAE